MEDPPNEKSVDYSTDLLNPIYKIKTPKIKPPKGVRIAPITLRKIIKQLKF